MIYFITVDTVVRPLTRLAEVGAGEPHAPLPLGRQGCAENLAQKKHNMKMEALKWTLALALGVGSALTLTAAPTLKVGDPAPKLQPGKWVQGTPVKDFQKGKAYLVEFWATWCPPCRASIPHLNEIYEKYKDKGLVVIGQNCSERDDSGVAAFVKKMGDKMTYRVALDNKTSNKEGTMAKTWMAAAGLDGIPSAFLVDTKGNIAWIGHPMALKNKVIEEVLAGTYDAHQVAQASTR